MRSIAVRSSLLTLVLMLAAARAFSQDGADLNLVCIGNGTVADAETTYVNTYDRKSKSYEYGTERRLTRRPFSGSGNVEVSGNFARIKPPRGLIPPLHSGDSGGWWTIQNLFMNDREINGSLKFNFANTVKIRIDRITGTISLSGGFGDFNGQCDRIDSNAARRF